MKVKRTRSLTIMDESLDLEQMIEEIDTELETLVLKKSKKNVINYWKLDENTKTYNESTESQMKCLPLKIGDGHQSEGCSRITQPRSCNRLQCYSCDLPVTIFLNQRWRFESDAGIFLRLHAPWDTETLSTRLAKVKGARAFCCQCRHFVAEPDCGLIQPPSTWYCRGH